MVDTQFYKNNIMSLDEFEIGLLEKDRTPGLLLRSDENSYYYIGVQINDNEVVKVDSAVENDFMIKIQYWADKVDAIREQFKERKAT